jgi:hypothetical protein
MSAPGPLRRRNAITRGQGDLCRLGGAVQLRLHTERAGQFCVRVSQTSLSVTAPT